MILKNGPENLIEWKWNWFWDELPINVGIWQIKYLNNIIEQDHRSIKRIVNPMLGFQSFQSANKTLKGIEAMNMIKKGQIKNLNYSVFNEVKYVNQLFSIIL